MKVERVTCRKCGKLQLEKKTIRLYGEHSWTGLYCSPECANPVEVASKRIIQPPRRMSGVVTEAKKLIKKKDSMIKDEDVREEI